MTADNSTICVFCQIIANGLREYVAEWNDAVAFVPLGPVVEGHVLVVPRQHVENATVDPEITAATMRRVAELAEQPCNIITSAGAEATQSVFHLHVHIVPREVGDGLLLPWSGKSRSDKPNLNPCNGRCEFHGKLWCEEAKRPCAEFMEELEARRG